MGEHTEKQFIYLRQEQGFPGGPVVKNPPANAGDARDTGSIFSEEMETHCSILA